MTLSVWVQGHPSRTALHRRLAANVAPLPFNLSLHTSEPPDPWAGYKLAVCRAVEECDASHLIVLQDDAIPCYDFPLAVADAIKDRPDDVLSLWVGDMRDLTAKFYRRAQVAKERWSPVNFSKIHHCVALVWPRALAEEFLEWTSTSMLPGDGRDQQSDDAIVGAWARRTHHQFWATVPSLVEHNDDVPSTIGRPQGGRDRRAIWFAGI